MSSPLRSPYLHVARLDIESGYEAACFDWLDRDFIPRVLGERGWTGAERYRCIHGEPHGLILYGLPEEPEDPFAGVIPLDNEMLARRMRNYDGRSYRRVMECGLVDSDSTTELINVISTTVHPDAHESFDSWYSDVHLPEIVACPGWLNGRRYRELGCSGAFLAVYQLEDQNIPFATPEYEAAVGWDGHDPELLGYHGFRVFELVTSVEL